MKNPALNFTDFSLMKSIQKEYAAAYLDRGQQKLTFYIPIDCDLIAKKMKVDAELVFQRLYSHLENKYGYKKDDGSRVHFFGLQVGDQRHCINYPYLCAILASLKEEKLELRVTQALAVASIVISIIALFAGGK